jgi:hydrogenase expression/formation protein HypC
MCLGVPGQITQIDAGGTGFPVGVVDFGGLTREVGLAFVPEAVIGDYVIVHAGYAISMIDEQEAQETLNLLRQMAELGGGPLPDSAAPGVAAGESPGA